MVPTDAREKQEGRALNVTTRIGRSALHLTVFMTGAVVMTIEVIGTRIIGPVFGVGLFVWSALLAVTLGSLGGGYYAGGVIADRMKHPRTLGVVVAASGVLLALVPALSRGVLSASASFGPRGGPLIGACLLFAAPLSALGMVGPISTKLATETLQSTGRRVGTVYAVSTAGSLLATLITGFVLIPRIEAQSILAACAGLLLILAAWWLVRGQRIAVLMLSLGVLLSGSQPSVALPAGITLEDRAQSLLGLVEVIRDDNRGVRFLRSDHSLLGAQFTVDGSSAFGFVHALEATRFFRPGAQTALAIGLGSGAAPKALGNHGLTVDIVEIDPIVARFAQRYFAFSAPGELYVDDARSYLRRTERRYDLVHRM